MATRGNLDRLLWLLAVLCLSVLVSPLHAGIPEMTYGQHLLVEASKRHPDVLELNMHMIPPGAGESVVIASSKGSVGEKSGVDERKVIDTGAPKLKIKAAEKRAEVVLALQDVSRHTIGALSMVLPYQTGDNQNSVLKKAERVRDELRRRTIELANLVEPYPYDPKFSSTTYSQHLVDEALKQHSEILLLALHGPSPAGAENSILASNFGRIGKKDDEGDYRPVKTGVPNMAIIKNGPRFNLGLPLQDAFGNTIGLMTIAYAYKAGDDQGKFLKKAEQVRNELRRRLIEVENLAEPHPFDPRISANTRGQKLIDNAMAKYPDLLVLAMHITPPGQPDNVINASNFGRIGKKSDDADVRLIASGQHNMAIKKSGDRYSGQLMLHDQAGRIIGSLAVVFPYRAGDDTSLLLRRAEQIRDELSKKIASPAHLLEPA